MGYPHEVAKQALLIVKNAGIAEAIDVIPQVIETMEKEKKQFKEDKILIKCWDCPDCTFLNQNQNFSCDMCGK
jgi:Zn finger protein HypA/HybF involved in hydrogenase expression